MQQKVKKAIVFDAEGFYKLNKSAIPQFNFNFLETGHVKNFIVNG